MGTVHVLGIFHGVPGITTYVCSAHIHIPYIGIVACIYQVRIIAGIDIIACVLGSVIGGTMAKARSKAGTFTEKQHVSYVAVCVYVEALNLLQQRLMSACVGLWPAWLTGEELMLANCSPTCCSSYWAR